MKKFCALVLVLAFAGSAFGQESDQAKTRVGEVIRKMLHVNNLWRGKYQLHSHILDDNLTKAAQDHAEYMARTGQFDHYVNGGPWNRAARHGFNGSCTENIAYGYNGVETAFVGWRNSSGHWANMSGNYTRAGFGYALSSSGTPYWVAMYGTLANDKPSPVTQAETEEDKNATSSDGGGGYDYTRRRGLFRRR